MELDPTSEPSHRNIGWMTEQACLLEATAAKVGNVHPAASFDDMAWTDFVISARAISPVLADAINHSLGRTILDATQATRHAVGANTNLGLILLLAPMCAVPLGESLTRGMKKLLERSTVDDAKLTYEAIRIATPAGMGKVDEADIQSEPKVSLLDTMRLAASRDSIAAQYADGFADLIEHITPRLVARLHAEAFVDDAIIGLHLECIARGDSLVARKHGQSVAQEVAARAKDTLDLFDKRFHDAAGRSDVSRGFDRWLRDRQPPVNPGTSADLTGAALFIALRDGHLKPPYRWRNSLRFDACES